MTSMVFLTDGATTAYGVRPPRLKRIIAGNSVIGLLHKCLRESRTEEAIVRGSESVANNMKRSGGRRVLVIDIGGTNVKVLAAGQNEPRKSPSGPTMTPRRMLRVVKKLVRDWKFDCVSLGFPGPIINECPLREPHNLGSGWMGFDFRKAFGCPVKVINDAAMQALGSYTGGRMLFLGLGTGLGAAMIVDGMLQPMELAHLIYKDGKTYEYYVGLRGLERLGKKKWRRHVATIVKKLKTALKADYVVLGGGNSKKLKKLPLGARLGSNVCAFRGGFRMWQK